MPQPNKHCSSTRLFTGHPWAQAQPQSSCHVLLLAWASLCPTSPRRGWQAPGGQRRFHSWLPPQACPSTEAQAPEAEVSGGDKFRKRSSASSRKDGYMGERGEIKEIRCAWARACWRCSGAVWAPHPCTRSNLERGGGGHCHPTARYPGVFTYAALRFRCLQLSPNTTWPHVPSSGPRLQDRSNAPDAVPHLRQAVQVLQVWPRSGVCLSGQDPARALVPQA